MDSADMREKLIALVNEGTEKYGLTLTVAKEIVAYCVFEYERIEDVIDAARDKFKEELES